jgi:hypothetical protein
VLLGQEEANPAFASYTQNRTLLGYVYAIIKNGDTATPLILDADADGVFTFVERHLLGTDDNLVDSDGDGVIDGQEYPLNRLSSDPRLP